MIKQLRIALTKKEREKEFVAAFIFLIEDGRFAITEEWFCMDELCSDRCTISIPPRVWAEAYPWIMAHTKPGVFDE